MRSRTIASCPTSWISEPRLYFLLQVERTAPESAEPGAPANQEHPAADDRCPEAAIAVDDRRAREPQRGMTAVERVGGERVAALQHQPEFGDNRCVNTFMNVSKNVYASEVLSSSSPRAPGSRVARRRALFGQPAPRHLPNRLFHTRAPTQRARSRSRRRRTSVPCGIAGAGDATCASRPRDGAGTARAARGLARGRSGAAHLTRTSRALRTCPRA